jgi:branched-chain amino acid aminotransferase
MKAVSLNGRRIEGPLPLDAADRGLTLGDGLFETMLVVNGVALWRHMHLARLEGSARELGIAYDADATAAAIAGILDGCGSHHHVLRLTVTRGAGGRGLAGSTGAPTLIVTLEPFDAALLLQPATLFTSTIRRSQDSLAARMKTLSYVDNIAAAREAAAHGADDALMLNSGGKVACATIANVFLVKKNKLVTPARDQAILTGVTRQALIAAAQHIGIMTEERAVTVVDLYRADGVFLTNSLRLIRPVTAVDRQVVPQADLAPLADALCATARLQCGRDPRLI